MKNEYLSNWEYAYAQVANSSNVSQTSIIPSIFLMVGIFVVFYVLTILPQKKKQKELENQIKATKKGDTILTSGGIYAKVIEIQDHYVFIKLSDQVKVKVAKWAITSVIKKDQKQDHPN